MKAWMDWFGSLGASGRRRRQPGRHVEDGAAPAAGRGQWRRRQPGERLFDHRSRRTIDDAVQQGQGLPDADADGGTVEVAPIIEMS